MATYSRPSPVSSSARLARSLLPALFGALFLICFPARLRASESGLTPEQQSLLRSTIADTKQVLTDSIELRQLLRVQRGKSAAWEQRWQRATANLNDLEPRLATWIGDLSNWGTSSAEVLASLERLSRELSVAKFSLAESKLEYDGLSATFSDYKLVTDRRIELADKQATRWRTVGIIAAIIALVGWLVAALT